MKGSFFKQRRFLDVEDLVRQLREWHEEVNEHRPSRATGVAPASRIAEERVRLRPLKVAPAELALRVPCFVGPTGYVLHETQQYSMPPDAIGIAGTLHLREENVRIVAGRFSAAHPRLFEKNAKSTLPGHRAEMVAKVSGTRGKRYLMRQHLLDVGGAALDYLTELVHRRPRTWVAEVERLHALLQDHGPDPLRDAFAFAIANKTFGAEYVAHFLADPHSRSNSHARAWPRTDELDPDRTSGIPLSRTRSELP